MTRIANNYMGIDLKKKALKFMNFSSKSKIFYVSKKYEGNYLALCKAEAAMKPKISFLPRKPYT